MITTQLSTGDEYNLSLFHFLDASNDFISFHWLLRKASTDSDRQICMLFTQVPDARLFKLIY